MSADGLTTAPAYPLIAQALANGPSHALGALGPRFSHDPLGERLGIADAGVDRSELLASSGRKVL